MARKIDKIVSMQQELYRQSIAFIPMIVNLSINSNNLWSPSRISGTRNHNLRNLLKEHLGYKDSKRKKAKVRCMVSGELGNGEEVIGAHIIPCASEEKKLRHLGMQLQDLSSVQNGLFLASGIEDAFDKLKLSFVKSNPLVEKLFLKIWDGSCRQTSIWPNSSKVIGDYDGHELELGDHKPFKRGLSYQAYIAYLESSSSLVKEDEPRNYGTPGEYSYYNERQLLESTFARDVNNEVDEDTF
jgi:hypothetical protein